MAEDVDLLKLKNIIMMERQPFTHHLSVCLLSCNRDPPVACKLYPHGRQSHANCTRMAASRMQISANFIHVSCDWRPRGYNLHATGGHLGTIYMPLAATRVQFICDCCQSHANLKVHKIEIFLPSILKFVLFLY
jgi:hypothetical protein